MSARLAQAPESVGSFPSRGTEECRRLGTNMTVVSAWHSVKENVHHNNTDCNTGNNIESENRRSGDGGKPLCKECARLG